MNKSVKNPEAIQPEFLSEILERISDGFVAVNNYWCLTYMNKKAGKLINRDPDKMIGVNIWTEFPDIIDHPFKQACEKAIDEQQYVFLEMYYPPTKTWFEDHIYPSADGLSIYFRDITNRKKSEIELKKREKLFSTAFHSKVFGLVIIDEARRVVDINETLTDLIGYKREELIGKSSIEIGLIDLHI